jgi:succinate dehydrogenase / fumarate reductase cytochrome b subunit
MTTRFRVFSSTVATKFLIAVTGLAMCLFLVGHLAGNLLLFIGPTTFNGYAHLLIANPLIPVIELGLALILLLHIYNTALTWWSNRRARPTPYYQRRWAGPPSRKSVPSVTMIYTGAVVLVFLVLHVKTFKYGVYYDVPGGGERDLYRLVIEFFRNPVSVLFYEASLVLLGFHLWHGFTSAWESLGANHTRFTPAIIWTGRIFATVIGSGFLLIPLWVHFLGGQS